MSNSEISASLDYARRLFERIIDWYKTADSKAQIILTLDGVFLTFLTTSVFKNPDELSRIIQRFNFFTWLFLALMCVCLIVSIISALMCLWSRVWLFSKRDAVLVNEKKRLKDAKKYSPNVMLFFKTISWLDHDKFQSQLADVNEEFEIKALASQSYLLSKRVNAKHLLVNLGFVLSGASLIFFLAGGISYLASFK
jgi:hypothetical protein